MPPFETLGQRIFETRSIATVTPIAHGDIATAIACRTRCPQCHGPLLDIRMKSVCRDCHAICETCCEGGRG